MVEKKLIVDGLRFNYHGPFDIIEFYRFVDNWISDHGMTKEIKKKIEHVEVDGKRIEWVIECWKQVTDYAKSVVRIKALFHKVQEIDMVKDKEKRTMNYGDALIIFDSFLETRFEGRWQQKPGFFFLRAIADKYIYKFWTEKHDEALRQDTYDMHNDLKEFFEMYK